MSRMDKVEKCYDTIELISIITGNERIYTFYELNEMEDFVLDEEIEMADRKLKYYTSDFYKGK